MSKKYEGLIVFDTKNSDKAIDELISEAGKLIESEGATLDEVNNLGNKQFAYNARQIQSGHYVSYMFNAESSAISAIKKNLDLADHIYMHQYRVQN